MEKITSIACAINQDIHNKNYGSAYATIKKTIKHWKIKDNCDLLSNDARIMVELYLQKQHNQNNS